MSTTTYVLSRHMKKHQSFLSENFQFLEVEFSIYLNRCVFVMTIVTFASATEAHYERSGAMLFSIFHGLLNII